MFALPTRDIKETERFYTQVLGLELAFRSTKRVCAIEALDPIGFKITQPELKRIEKNAHV